MAVFLFPGKNIFFCINPTNITSMHLVMGCPNFGAGVTIVRKKEPLVQSRATQISPPITNCH